LLANVQRPMEAASREHNQTTLGEKSLIETIPGLAVWAGQRWFPLALLTVGWGVAFFVARMAFGIFVSTDSEIVTAWDGWLMAGLIGGGVTALALRSAAPHKPTLSWPLIVGIWVGLALLGPWLYTSLRDNGLGPDEALAVSLALFGGAGGAGTSITLYRAGYITDTQRLLIICAGWAIAWAVAVWLGLQVINLFGDDPSHGIKEALKSLGLDSNLAFALVPWVDALLKGLMGALAGFISGWVTVGQLRKPEAP
ncbi:MAG: hypothetical protein ACT4QE_18010, partial [Anaerolineales bacterium]